MRKLCPRCGVYFEVKSDNVFCSEKCRRLFQQSGLDLLKGKSPEEHLRILPSGDEHSEIIRPKKQKG